MGWRMDERADAGARAVGLRRVCGGTDVAGTAAVAGGLAGLWARVPGELDLLPVHAGLRECVGGGGADPGGGADLSGVARDGVAAYGRPDHERNCVSAGRAGRVVRVDEI